MMIQQHHWLTRTIKGILSMIFCISLFMVYTPSRTIPGDIITQQDGHFHKMISIPIDENGHISSKQLFTTLLTEFAIDAKDLSLPDVKISFRGLKGALTLNTLNTLTGPGVDFVKDHRYLNITIDEEKERVGNILFRKRISHLLQRFTETHSLTPQSTLTLPDIIQQEKPLVLLVHGVDSDHSTWADLSQRFLLHRIQYGYFDYPNDGPIDASAYEFSDRLQHLSSRFPELKIIIVAHSMGGLVSRYILEDASLDPKNVHTLIMVATPNHGSYLGSFRSANDLLEWVRGGMKPHAFYANIKDGLGQAGDDLIPESVFLRKLNGQQRNPNVSYHLFLGNQTPVDASAIIHFKNTLDEILTNRMTSLKRFRGLFKKILHDVEELEDGKGDMAVAVKRGRLEGVQDTRIFPYNHLSIIQETTDSAKTHPVLDAIVEIVQSK